MHNTWGQPVGNTRTNLRIASVHLSPYRRLIVRLPQTVRVQLPLPPKLFVSFTLYLSPAKLSILPLIEHYLYPVSTVPITNPNQIN
jgi:hypothetical protein